MPKFRRNLPHIWGKEVKTPDALFYASGNRHEAMVQDPIMTSILTVLAPTKPTRDVAESGLRTPVNNFE